MPSADREEGAAVSVEPASEAERALLANLLELYIHDLSAIFEVVQLGADGRFGYPRLASYWSEPGRRFPFLIRNREQVVGFALVQRGSPLSDDPEVFDVAEFFVLRSARRSGIGARAAQLIWDRLPGRWIVRVSEANQDALPFWAHAIQSYAGNTTPQTVRGWRVFSFATRALPAEGAP